MSIPQPHRAAETPRVLRAAENLKNSGYLLRGWLSVQKIAEVKRLVIDPLPAGKK